MPIASAFKRQMGGLGVESLCELNSTFQAKKSYVARLYPKEKKGNGKDGED